MAANAALQQTLITFQSRSPPSSQLQTRQTIRFSGLKLPKLIVKQRKLSRHSGGGASGARMADSVSGSYANALADVAISNNTLDQTSADLEKVDKFFSDEQIMDFFTNPILKDSDKKSIIDEFTTSSELLPHVANFLNILVDMKRIDIVKEIVKDFEVVFNKLTDTELALVTSVVQLEEQHLTQIAKTVQKLTGSKNVRIKTQLDPSLVAGFTVRYGNAGSKLIDMSVRKQLEEIALELDLGDIQLVA